MRWIWIIGSQSLEQKLKGQARHKEQLMLCRPLAWERAWAQGKEELLSVSLPAASIVEGPVRSCVSTSTSSFSLLSLPFNSWEIQELGSQECFWFIYRERRYHGLLKFGYMTRETGFIHIRTTTCRREKAGPVKPSLMDVERWSPQDLALKSPSTS